MRLIFYLVLLLSPFVTVAFGQDMARWQGLYQDLELSVTVVARGHTISEPIRSQEPWWRWGNTETDAYLFSFEGRGTELIIDFSVEGPHPKASIYVLPPAQGRAVSARPGGYSLPKRIFPTYTVQPVKGGWWNAGKPNFNLRTAELDRVNGQVLTKGRVGARTPGVPAWSTSRLLKDPNPRADISRFDAVVRKDPSVVYRLAEPLLPSWPYLSVKMWYDHFGPNTPLFYELGRRQFLSRWTGFQIAGTYAFNSYAYPPFVAFESPFAWYRFDPNFGNYANLVIRADVWPPGNVIPPEFTDRQRTQVRMSWTGEEADRWRYSLSVSGDHPLEGERPIRIGDYTLRSISYDAYPHFVPSHAWPAVTFVEASAGYAGSEGIYDYSVEGFFNIYAWLFGVTDSAPTDFYTPYLTNPFETGVTSLREGFRGEFNVMYNRQPRLYFSPIDRRVHLFYADSGIWNLGEGRVLRWLDGDGDGFTDSWFREVIDRRTLSNSQPRALPGQVEEELNATTNYLVAASSDQIVIHQRGPMPNLSFVPFPTDRNAWHDFLAQVTPTEGLNRDPWHLRGWMQDMAGKTLTVNGAAMRDFRRLPQGFRFVLRANRTYHTTGGMVIPALSEILPGQYVITYNQRTRSWSRALATPPNIVGTLESSNLQAYNPGEVTLRLRNTGNLDLSETSNLLIGDEAIKKWSSLVVPGQGAIEETFGWSPARAGDWPVELEITGKKFPLGQVRVAQVPRITGDNAFNLSVGEQSISLIPLLLLIVLIGGALIWLVWQIL